MQNRVCYFSKTDLLTGHYLEMAEKRIQEVSEGSALTSLEDVIELWQIRRMLEDDCRLLKWTDVEFEKLKSLTSEYNSIVAKFFNGLNPDKVQEEFESLSWAYKKAFWKIIDTYHCYRLITSETLVKIVSKKSNLRGVLECKGIVEKHKTALREVFLNNYECALIIINKFAAKNDSHDREIFLPSNLTLDDKEEILKNYLQSNNPNVNYVRLVTQIKNVNGQIRISPKTKLLAERLAKKLGDEMLSDPKTVTVNWSIRVQFADEDGVEPVWVETDDNGTPTYSYSIPYIRKCDNVNRVANCVLLFQWLNRHALLNLINKNTEVDKFESLLIDKGRDSYPSYMAFENKSKLSLYQLFGYDDILKKSGSYFERELKLFYEHYLKEQFDYPSLPLTIPNSDDSALIKCRVLCPELDAIVKQYNIFIVEDEIDKDLIRLSQPLKVEEGKSFLVNKYYEIAEGNEEIQSVLWGLFGSGNSMLSHVEPFTDKDYSSLVELLEKESNVQYSNYANFQKPHLNFLIQQGLIGINSDGGLYVVSQPKLKVLKSLWEYEACSYWHYNDEERNALDDMFAKGWLVKDEHLLSKPERDYFSFFLDNAKFTNGKAYRNHYMHGSTPPVDDENEHSLAYLTFLRLLAILLLKIEDDLWLARRVFAIYVTNEIKTHRGRS